MEDSMIRLGILAISLIAICACHGGTSDPNAPLKEQLKDITDKSACVGSPKPGNSLFQTWRKTLASKNLRVEMSLEFDLKTVWANNTCYFNDGSSIDVSTSSPIRVAGNLVEILFDKESSWEEPNGDGEANSCAVAIKASAMSFAIVGDCLELNENGAVDYFVK
jgi:hypothetical protein